MHEYSVVSALLEQCEKYASENGSTKVVSLKVRIGKQSGVVPELLASAFEMFRIGTVCEDARLDMEVIPLLARCQSCEHEFEPQDYCFLCPKCQSGNTKLVTGKEMHLMSLEME